MVRKNQTTRFTFKLLICSVIIQYSTQDPGWSIKGVREPNCLKCSCMGTGLSETSRPTILKIMSQKLYEPIQSRSSRLFAQILIRGKVALTKTDIDNLCSVTHYDLDSSVGTFGLGDGKNITWTYNIKRLSRVSYYNLQQRHDPMDMPESFRKSYMNMGAPQQLSFVWTDGSSFLATVCRFDGQTTWLILSIHKTLSRKTKKKILEKVAKLGFDPALAYTSDYTNCK